MVTKREISTVMAALGKKGGKAKTAAKITAVRANGLRGGRNEGIRQERTAWMGKMAEYPLTSKQRANLENWERAHLDGHSVATSDWPEWQKLIGKRPW